MNFLEVIYKELSSLLSDGLNVGADVLIGLIVLLVGFIIAKIISGIFKKFVDMLNAERYMDKLREVDLFAGMNISLSALVSKLVFWVLMFVFIMLSLRIMGLDMVSNGIYNALGYLPKIISALVFFVIATFLANGAKVLVASSCEAMGIASGKILSNILFYFFLLMIAIVALNQAGMNTDMISENFQIILTTGLLGLALGFGLSSRDLFSNMLGGYYSKEKFKIGQTIEFENMRGEIVGIDSTSLTLDLGEKKVVIPLKKVAETNVIIHN